MAGEDMGKVSLLDVLDKEGSKVLGKTLGYVNTRWSLLARERVTHPVIGGVVDVDDLLETLDFCGLVGDSLDV